MRACESLSFEDRGAEKLEELNVEQMVREEQTAMTGSAKVGLEWGCHDFASFASGSL